MQTRNLRLAALLGTLVLGSAAMAQTTTTTAKTDMSSRSSWLPYTHNGYIGLDVGRSSFQNNCTAGFTCDRSDDLARISLGGYFNPNFGAEIAYADYGDMRRAGGTSSAKGVSLSLVGRAPLTESWGLYGRLGATYGQTRVSSAAGSGVVAGKENSWGPAAALGISYQFTPNWSTSLEVARQRFEFAGNNDEWVRSTQVGLRYHF